MSEPVVQQWPAGTTVVAVEGIDGAGKSTLLEGLTADAALRRAFAGVHAVREFDGPLGTCLRASLHALSPISIIYAFAAERQWLIEQSASLGGGLVLWDRYTDSVHACRAADVEAGLAASHVLGVVRETTARMPPPHLTLWVDTPVPVAFDRMVRRQADLGLPVRSDTRMLEFQRAAYLGRLTARGRTAVQLDGALPPAELVARASDAVLRQLARPGPGDRGGAID